MKNATPTITIFLAVLGVLLSGAIVAKVNSDKPAPITPLPPPKKPFAHGIGATGLIEADQENIRIGMPVPGLVSEVFVKVWDEIEADAPLFSLDSTELMAQLPTQEAEVKVRRAQLKEASDRLRRMERLTSVASAQDLENTRNEAAIAEALRDAAEASVIQTRSLLDRLTVRAPSAGTVLQVNTRPGEYLTPTAAEPPMILGQIDSVQVRAEVDEQVAPRIRPGARAVGFIKGDAGKGIPLDFVRIEPFVIPKRSLTGSGTERVDTRVLQVIYRFPRSAGAPIYVGQQMDLFIEAEPADVSESAP
jgi:multidrug efflux pump subunit AcrA (membrane-fusion protein)